MSITEDLADALAIDVIKAMDLIGDEELANEVATMMGATSQTAEEAFLTAVRVRRANIKARAFLLAKLQKFKADQETAKTATKTDE
ncbi:MAG: hypothetical protein P1U83_04530 [Roseovarius sp.]|nr:hypothetical protein [Roseovarius sp.]